MKIIRRTNKMTLLLELKDFKSDISIKRVSNNCIGHRFNTVLVPEEMFDNFKDSDLYKAVYKNIFVIGGTLEIANYIKY